MATRLEESLLGRSIDEVFLAEIQRFDAHPCGEFGEYHTFVTAGPIFKEPVKIAQGRREKRDNAWFLEISAEFDPK